MSEYEKQAEQFLSRYGIKFTATFKGDKCPLWDNDKHIHGDRYLITFARISKDKHPVLKSRFNLSFWNSLSDKEQGKEPTPYDVLASITKYDPGTFSDFCGEYGYDEDSRKGYATYKAVVKEWQKVKGFFSSMELHALEQIQ